MSKAVIAIMVMYTMFAVIGIGMSVYLDIDKPNLIDNATVKAMAFLWYGVGGLSCIALMKYADYHGRD